MRKNKAETAESRRRILEKASRLFRERGPERVSVSDVMAAAGMTHGGFYKHFASKDGLVAATIAAMFAAKLAPLSGTSPDERKAALRRHLDAYLTLRHAEDRATGCPIAGLASDTGRVSKTAAAALASGTAETLERFEAATESEEAAIRALSLAVGAIVLARMVGDARLRGKIVEAARRAARAELAGAR